jgi:putative DNA primase/helicase
VAKVTSLYQRATSEAPPPPPPGPDQPLENWKDLLRVNRDGLFIGDVLNVSLALKFAPEWSGLLGWDESWQTVKALRQPVFGTQQSPPFIWDEEHSTLLQAWLIHQGFASISERTIERAVKAVAVGHSFHAVRRYLDSLKWDGVSRIDGLLSTYLGVKDSAYTRAVSKNFMISAVARAMKPGVKCDTVLILEGSTRLKKSTFLEKLAGTENFANNSAGFSGRDAHDQAHGVWIIEIQEIDHILASVGASRAKAFVTIAVDYYRKAYGRQKQRVPRDSVMCGTTNKQQYLIDETGNRRYWPVFCTKADDAAIERDRDQLWAEGVHRYRAGEPWWLTPDLEALAAEEQKARLLLHPWEDIVLPFIQNRKDVSVAEIFGAKGPLASEKLTPKSEQAVAAILRSEGWTQYRPAAKKIGGKPGPRPPRRYRAPSS